MEFQTSFLAIISSFLFFLIWFARIYKVRRVSQNLPPGPWKLPLIGNLHQLALADTLPHHALKNLAQKYGPLMHLQMGEISAVIVSSPDMAKEILKTHDLNFANRPELLLSKILMYESADIGYAPYGEYWRQMKKTCMIELLSAKRVKSFSFIREDEVAKLIKTIQISACAGSQVDFSESVFSLISSIMSRTAFGKKTEHHAQFLSLVKKAAELVGGFDLSDLFPSWKFIHAITGMKAKLEDMKNKLDVILENIISEHQSNHGDVSEAEEDVVHVLLRIQQNGNLGIPITMDNVKAVIWVDIFGAGTDTSATALEWAMSELLKNPRVMKKVQAEIREAFSGMETICENNLSKLSYLKSVIKETLRLHPPAPLLMPRECREACKIDEYEIPRKTKVIVNAWALGRDPKYWNDAEMFIPERFDGSSLDFKGNNYEYIPFGAGRRMCPGLLLGLVNVEFPLAALLFHFDWKLPNGMNIENLDMAESFGAAVRRKNNLHLIPTPYHFSCS